MERIQAEEGAGIIELSDEEEILRSPPPSPPPGPGGYSRAALIDILSGDDDVDEDALLASPPSTPAKEMKQELMSSVIEIEDNETDTVPQPTTSIEGIEIKLLRTKLEDEEERLLATPPPFSPKENNQEHENQIDDPDLLDEDTVLLDITQPTSNNDPPVTAIEDEDTQVYSVQLPSTSNDESEDLDDDVIFISSTVASPQEVYEISDSDEEETERFSPRLISRSDKVNTTNTPSDVVEVDEEQLGESQKSKSESNETDSINPETATTTELNELELPTILTAATKSNETEITTSPTEEMESTDTKSTTNRIDEIELTIPQIDETQTDEPKLIKMPQSVIPNLSLPHVKNEFKSGCSFDSVIKMSPNLQSTSSCVDSKDGKDRILVQLNIKDILQSLKSRGTLLSNSTAMVVIPSPTRYEDERNDPPVTAIEDEDTQVYSVQLPSTSNENQIDDPDLLDEDTVLLDITQPTSNNDPPVTAIEDEDTQVYSVQLPSTSNGDVAKPLNKVLESCAQSSSKHSTDDTLTTPKGPTCIDEPMAGPSSRYGPINTGKETSGRVSPIAHAHTLSSKHSVDTISTSLRTSNDQKTFKSTELKKGPIPQVPIPDTENKYVTGRPDLSRLEDLKTFKIIAEFKRITIEQQSKKEECWASYWKTSDHAKQLINNIESYQNQKLTYGHSLKNNGKNNKNRASLQNHRDVVNFQSNQNNVTASEQSCSHLTTSNTLDTDEQNLHDSHALCTKEDIVTTKNIKNKRVTFRDPLEEVYEIKRIEFTNQTKKIHGYKRKNSDGPRGPSKKQQKWNESLQNAARSVLNNNLKTETVATASKHTNDSACINQAESKQNLRDIATKNSRNSEIIIKQNNELKVQLQFPPNFSNQHYDESIKIENGKEYKTNCKNVDYQKTPTTSSMWINSFQRKDRTHKNTVENSHRNQIDSSQSDLFVAGTSNQEPLTEQNQNPNINIEMNAETTKIKYEVKLKDDLKITFTKRKNRESREDVKKRRCSRDITSGIEPVIPINTVDSTDLQNSDSQRLNVQQESETVRRTITLLPSHASNATSREDLQENMPNRNISPTDFYHTDYFFHNEMIQRSNDLKFFNYNIPPRLETPPPSPEFEEFLKYV